MQVFSSESKKKDRAFALKKMLGKGQENFCHACGHKGKRW